MTSSNYKPFGFPMHACIDGWSRKVLWLYVTRSNNWPHNIATYYLDAVENQGECPQKLITDLGTENGLMASIHSFFRDDLSSHRYVPSPRNQRSETWWSYFRRSRTNWWIIFFKDLEHQGTFNPASELESECLWFCFAPLLQEDIEQLKEHWNTHYIGKSRHDTVSGLLLLPCCHLSWGLFSLSEIHMPTSQTSQMIWQLHNFQMTLPFFCGFVVFQKK